MIRSRESAPTALDQRDAIARGDTTCAQLIDQTLAEIASKNDHLRAFLSVHDADARERAETIDARLSAGEPLPLAGVCIALKDNICLDRGTTTCASRMLEHYRSPFSATVASRLEAAGAIIVGKTNLDEFAMGSSCEHSAFGGSRNPWHDDHVPGGSSGGSATAVSAGLVPIALGSDTGGSIRQPASHCGIVGFKPTYGRVSRYGLVAFGSSLDQIGPMTRTVADAALCYDAIAGHDPHDATSHPDAPPTPTTPTNTNTGLNTGLNAQRFPLRLGVPIQARSEGLNADVARVLEQTIAKASDAGAEIVEVDLAQNNAAIAAYYIVACAEASSNLARYDGIRFGTRPDTLASSASLDDLYIETRTQLFGDEVKRRILLGTHVLSSGYYDAYYNTALKARRLIKQGYDRCLSACDAILMPAAPTPAFRIGEKLDDPIAMYLEDLFTVGVNLAGLPAITIPAGTTTAKPTLPIGMQLIGRAFDDSNLLSIAATMERVLAD